MANAMIFTHHNLCVFAFAACRISVKYGGSQHVYEDDEISDDKTELDESRYPSIKSGIYTAFASPLEIAWTSKDSIEHELILNLGDIFKNKEILHSENENLIYLESPIAGDVPTIIIEIDNRTLNIYMFVSIQVIDKTSGKRKINNHRNLVFSKEL